MGVTIRDVAQHAGVSISTVSRVLNQTAPVNPEKHRRVMTAVDALGYRPNPVAISLLKQSTGIVGVVLPSISGEFFAELLLGLDDTVQEHGYLLLVSASDRHEAEFKAALKSISRRVDGFLIMAPEITPKVAHELLEEDIPVVFVNTPVYDEMFDVFHFDNYGGMYALTSHLLERGHQRIAFIKGPTAAYDAQDRLRAYRDAMRQLGGEYVEALEFDGDFSAECGYRAAQLLMQSDTQATALIGANDLCAQGALRYLLLAGVRVPEDMALAGFDDIPSARYSTPSLTTVRVPIRNIAMQVVHHLIARISDPDACSRRHHCHPVQLVIRESSGFRMLKSSA